MGKVIYSSSLSLKDLPYLFEKQNDREREKSSIYCFTPQMAAATRGLDLNQGHRIPSGFPMWVAGALVPGPSSRASSSTLAGSWIASGTART